MSDKLIPKVLCDLVFWPQSHHVGEGEGQLCCEMFLLRKNEARSIFLSPEA